MRKTVCMQGTGFMALQSCANHSCAPNAATEGEGSGFTAVYARRPIKAGEEVTITYIEEDEDGTGKAMSYKQRQVRAMGTGLWRGAWNGRVGASLEERRVVAWVPAYAHCFGSSSARCINWGVRVGGVGGRLRSNQSG